MLFLYFIILYFHRVPFTGRHNKYDLTMQSFTYTIPFTYTLPENLSYPIENYLYMKACKNYVQKFGINTIKLTTVLKKVIII